MSGRFHLYKDQRKFFRTREEIVSLFYNHIKAVNQIYETTDFGGILGLNFVIQRTTVSYVVKEKREKTICQALESSP